jgi:hypothetical protein
MILNRPKVELTEEECGALGRIVIDLKCATGDIREFWGKAFAATGGQA